MEDRRAGQVMYGVAVAGVVVALVGAVVGWSLVGRLDAAAGDTLGLTVETLATFEDTIVVADEVVGSTVAALGAVEVTLAELVATTEATQPLIESLAQLGSDVAPNLESATATLRSLEDLGGTIDVALSALGALPIAPSYNPDATLSQQFGRLADDIEPVAATLRDVSDEIGATAGQTAALQERIADLEVAVGAVRNDLAASDILLSGYSETAQEARSLAERTERGLSVDVAAARLLVVLAAIVFGVGQIVPYWYGRELLQRTDTSPR